MTTIPFTARSNSSHSGAKDLPERLRTGTTRRLWRQPWPASPRPAQLGIDNAQPAEAIEGGPPRAPIADAKLHKMARGDFALEFPLEWALKDVDLAIAAAGSGTLPVLAALARQWRAAVDAGHGREGVSAAHGTGPPSRSWSPPGSVSPGSAEGDSSGSNRGSRGALAQSRPQVARTRNS